MNQAISNVTSGALNLIPTSVKDAAGLNKQILEEVRHITTLVLENVAWLTERRLYLVNLLGYVDGFQIWDVQDPSGGRELVSARLDKAVSLVKLLPRVDAPGSHPQPPHPREGRIVAYVQKTAPREVHMYNAETSQEPHLIRVTKPALSLHATQRILAISMQDQVDLHDIRNYQSLFSVQTAPCTIRPTFALGPRWAAYKVPNEQATNLSHLNKLGGAQAPKDVLDATTQAFHEGISYIGALSQQALDSLLMPPTDARGPSLIAVRDVSSRQVLCQLSLHKEEPIEYMTWDPSGLLLISITQMGHTVLVHRAAATPSPRSQSAQGVQVNEEDETTNVSFDHVFTLNRGFTPAIISDICLSEDSQMIAICSAKGTIHVFTLPIDVRKRISRKQSTGSPQIQVLNSVTRIKLGSLWLQEGLLPCAAFDASKGTSNVRTLCAATKAGMLSLFSLRLLRHEEGKIECFLNVNRNLRAFRPRGNFVEKALDRTMPSPTTSFRTQTPPQEDSSVAATPEDDARRWLAEIELPEVCMCLRPPHNIPDNSKLIA
eukprot:GEMP01036130.1.p1 GENE.GEMP01036130.1~~GEMP01036130.1.p1  ORF type:complete len:546 (+),score=68.06 GEMP01036130.1:26-1663(+)